MGDFNTISNISNNGDRQDPRALALASNGSSPRTSPPRTYGGNRVLGVRPRDENDNGGEEDVRPKKKLKLDEKLELIIAKRIQIARLDTLMKTKSQIIEDLARQIEGLTRQIEGLTRQVGGLKAEIFAHQEAIDALHRDLNFIEAQK